MMKLILSITCLVTMVTCLQWSNRAPYFPIDGSYFNRYHGDFSHNIGFPHNRWIYYGQFGGSCEGAHDGLYYVNEYSFAYCSNGQKSIQPCAEGSANPSVAHFHRGNYYGFYDFCSVNLVDYGYHQSHYAPAHVSHKQTHIYHNDKVPYGKEESYQVHESKTYHKADEYHGKHKLEEHKTEYKHQSYKVPKRATH